MAGNNNTKNDSTQKIVTKYDKNCLLYTSDAADEL